MEPSQPKTFHTVSTTQAKDLLILQNSDYLRRKENKAVIKELDREKSDACSFQREALCECAASAGFFGAFKGCSKERFDLHACEKKFNDKEYIKRRKIEILEARQQTGKGGLAIYNRDVLDMFNPGNVKEPLRGEAEIHGVKVYIDPAAEALPASRQYVDVTKLDCSKQFKAVLIEEARYLMVQIDEIHTVDAGLATHSSPPIHKEDASRPKRVELSGSSQPPDDSLTAKEQGNKAFEEKRYEEAIEHWSRGVHTCQFVLSKNAYQGEQKKSLEDLLCVLNLNLAAGYLKLGNWHNCIHKADSVLNYDPTNLKALFRKADALSRSNEFSSCIEALNSLLAIYPDHKPAKNLRVKVLHEWSRSKVKEQKIMKKLFSNLESDPRSLQPENQSILPCVLRSVNNWVLGPFRVMCKMAKSCTWCGTRNKEKAHKAVSKKIN